MKAKKLFWGLNALLVLAALFPIALSLMGLAPQGTYDAHDPSRIVFNKGFYYYFSTGDKIRMHYSADMIHWNVGPSPLLNGVPQWAKRAVPLNGGDFVWAPDLFFNPATNLWTMFYAYSSWGSQTSVIGALTSPDLTLDSVWQDAGPVVASDSARNYNAIDPCPLYVPGRTPTTGSLYLSFGSYWTGIKGVQLNPTTLKPIGAIAALAGNTTWIDMEGSYIWSNGGYYYLFYTQGTCCQGVNSTYHILMGRSKAPLGPYSDESGQSLLSGGGTPFYARNGSVIGPGQPGISVLDNIVRASFHYYDGNADGSPKLGIQSLLTDSNGWPVMGSDLADGVYRISSQQNGLTLGVAGESNAEATPVDQWKWLNHPFQRWTVKRQVDGTYTIQSVGNNKAMHVMGGSDAVGSAVVVESLTGADAQRWVIDQLNDGSYRLRTVTGTVIDVPSFSTTPGTKMWTYTWLNGANQHWNFTRLY